MSWNQLKDKYVKIHKQGWIPIFVGDSFDALDLASICVNADFEAIELTCRRPDVVKEIKLIKSTYPDLMILVGSTVDNNRMVDFIRHQNPKMPYIKELAELGVDGFVAQLPFMKETLLTYSKDFIMVPGVQTIKEAYESLQWGAHFVKFCQIEPEKVKQVNSLATHSLFPLFITGGVSQEKIPSYIQAGAALLAAGWDMMLKGIYEEQQKNPVKKVIQKRLVAHKKALLLAREKSMPNYTLQKNMNTEEYIRILKNYHPFL